MIVRVRRTIVGALAAVFVLVLLGGALPLGPALFSLLLVAEPPRRADAIVVLGGGVHDEELPSTGTTSRLVHGLRLHHRGYAPVVILTGGNPAKPSIPEAAVMRRVAEELRTPADVLVTELVADRTSTQAEAVARIARERGIRTILLVTSGEHSWRATRVFRKAGLTVISTPVVPRVGPRFRVVVHPIDVVNRLTAFPPLLYESGAIALYWWRGWL